MKNGKYKEGWGVAAFAASDALTALAVLERSQRQLHERERQTLGYYQNQL